MRCFRSPDTVSLMVRLKDRNKQIPGGMRFYESSIRFTAPPGSLEAISQSVRNARLANPAACKQYNLSIDIEQVRNEVDFFNATMCKNAGWNDYILGAEGGASSAPPFPLKPLVTLKEKAANVAAGASVLVEWISSGAEAVPMEQANARAEVCSKCPLNSKGGLESFFTTAVSAAIRKALDMRHEMKLSTPYDSELNVCSACLCPMSLKVHVPFDKFYPKMSDETKTALDPNCWIRSEALKG